MKLPKAIEHLSALRREREDRFENQTLADRQKVKGENFGVLNGTNVANGGGRRVEVELG
jgi:hypothetical protein